MAFPISRHSFAGTSTTAQDAQMTLSVSPAVAPWRRSVNIRTVPADPGRPKIRAAPAWLSVLAISVGLLLVRVDIHPAVLGLVLAALKGLACMAGLILAFFFVCARLRLSVRAARAFCRQPADHTGNDRKCSLMKSIGRCRQEFLRAQRSLRAPSWRASASFATAATQVFEGHNGNRYRQFCSYSS